MKSFLGTALGVVAVLLVIVLGYEVVTGKPITGGVQRTMERVGPEVLQQVRSDPEGMFIHAKDENLPAFLAFIDLDTAVSDNAVAEYNQLMSRIEKYFTGDTRKDIVKSVFVIRAASIYYPDLTCLQCLLYLNDCIPADFDPQNPSGPPSASVRQMGDEINAMLVMKYYEPQMEAMKQQQAAQAEYQARVYEAIRENAENARARGAARNAERAAQVARPIYGDQAVDWAWQNYRYRRGY